MAPRLKELYNESVAPALREKFSYANHMQIPKIEKVVINMGLGRLSDGGKDNKVIERLRLVAFAAAVSFGQQRGCPDKQKIPAEPQ